MFLYLYRYICSEMYKSVTFIIQEHILWFEVSVDDSVLVEVLQALDDLSSIVTGSCLIKSWVVLIHIINVIPSVIRESIIFLGLTKCAPK